MASSSTFFTESALQLFAKQRKHNKLYAQYLAALNYSSQPTKLEEIPFLPISFFKTHDVVSEAAPYDLTFTSSGTSGMQTSRHFVKDKAVYIKSFMDAFAYFYGAASQYCILGLLPSYVEQGGSSLVYMVNYLIQQSQYGQSNTFLHNHHELAAVLKANAEQAIPTILIGVTYALLDFAEQYPMQLADSIIIMETGGMKGRRRELIRSQVHQILGNAFGRSHIHSEYGMTELLSQAYSKGNGIFQCPPSMKVLVRDANDPFSIQQVAKGAINIIDLSNINSCAFIATDDVGECYSDGTFSISGRLDNSDIRGCSLLAL